MIALPATQPDFSGRLRLVARDSEGHVTALPEDLDIQYLSDNPTAIEIIPNPTDPHQFTVHVGGPNPDGSPAQATLTANVFRNNVLIGVASEVFIVTGGAAEVIQVGALEFDLTAPE